MQIFNLQNHAVQKSNITEGSNLQHYLCENLKCCNKPLGFKYLAYTFFDLGRLGIKTPITMA